MDALVTLDNKRIGSVKNNVYKKTVTRSKHYFRVFNGYGISVSILEELKQAGVTQIEIKEKDTKNIYTCSVEDYFTYGTQYSNKDDKQLILNIFHFKKQN